MGCRDCFKTIISSKKVKNDNSKKLKGSSAPEKSNGIQWEEKSKKESTKFSNSDSKGNTVVVCISVKDIAATRIQTAFRAHKARKALRLLKGIMRLQTLTKGESVRKQALNTLSYLHSWNRIQAEIRARRLCMVTEGRIRQKKLENQLKLEAKLHGIEADWSGGSNTMEEVLSRIHLREAAAVKRERAMAYAFSHQWRANSKSNLGPDTFELGKANWGWSWMERWIAARPWESRALVQSSPNKTENQQAIRTSENTKSPTLKKSSVVKSTSPNGKVTTKARKLSYGVAENVGVQKGKIQAEELSIKREHMAS